MDALQIKYAAIGGVYRLLLKRWFFLFDPEKVHDGMTRLGAFLGRHGLTKKTTEALFAYSDKRLEQKILGITFKNPVGLAAGFDKEGLLVDILPSVGFGFMEIGSVTGQPCAGNPKPRLWRLVKSKSLAVYYGLKNGGCEAVSQKLGQRQFGIPLGVSVAKTNIARTDDVAAGIADYAKAFVCFSERADYLTVNISCPNTTGGQPFLEVSNLDRLFDELDRIPTLRPVFVKFSPDLDGQRVDALLEVLGRHRVHGIICSNLTKKRTNGKIADDNVPSKGGLSGKVVEELSNDLIARVRRKTGDRFVIVGCGGIFSAEDAYRKIKLGASLVQLVTGMIFQGPQLIGEINRGLTRLLEKDGFSSLSEAIGKEIK